MSCFYPADILLPKNASKEDMQKWAVIACDQYTSDEEYWDDVKEIVGDAPSSLNIMLPEIYLEKDNTEKIEKINKWVYNNFVVGLMTPVRLGKL